MKANQIRDDVVYYNTFRGERHMWSSYRGRKLIFTKEGYMGLGPKCSEPGIGTKRVTEIMKLELY
jgi:hypothetical protein